MSEPTTICFHPSPLGLLRLEESEAGVTALEFAGDGEATEPKGKYLPELCRQLDEYFAGARRAFDVPLDPAGTDFQKKVWNALLEIPYGETRSYGDIAARVGRPGAARAVGGANGANRICIVIPCHRVIATDGGLGGYSSGLERKRALLALERGEMK